MNVIITGAGKGIGFATVKSFLQNTDASIIAISRHTDQLTDLASQNQGRLMPITFSLNDFALYDSLLLPEIGRVFAHVDILIHNAGFLINKPFDELDEIDFDSMFGINTKAPFLLTKALLPMFVRDTHVICISSMGGYQGSVKFSGLSLYSASKGALAILCECMAEELKPKGVKANCLALGAVQTEMLSSAFPNYVAPLQSKEMGDFISHFALTGHKFFNGKVLPVSLSIP